MVIMDTHCFGSQFFLFLKAAQCLLPVFVMEVSISCIGNGICFIFGKQSAVVECLLRVFRFAFCKL